MGKSAKQIKSIFVIFFGLFVLLAGFQNCDIKKPRVENLSMMSVRFTHPATIVSCQSCHEKDRPALVGSLSHPNKSDQSVYTLDGSDPGDCIKCHEGAQTSGTWKNLIMTGNYHATATSCGSCHDTGGVADRTSSFLAAGSAPHSSVASTLSGGGHPSATMINGKDCYSCHTAPATSTRTSVIEDWLKDLKIANGLHASVTNCKDCHQTASQFDRTTTWNSSTPTVSPFFSGGHASSSNYDCSSCHTAGTVSSDWSSTSLLKLSAFHTSATECSSCHASGQKKDRIAFYKSGPSTATSTGTGSTQTFTLTNKGGHPNSTLMSQNGASDCNSCHNFQTSSSFGTTPTSWAWNEFNLVNSFHLVSKFPSMGNWNGTGTANGSANLSATGRCVTCHGSGAAFDRTIIVKSTHTGGAPGSIAQDCTYCHATGNQVSDWVGKSNFVHPANFATAGSKYCYECHLAPNSITLPPNPATKDGLVANRRVQTGHLGAEAPNSSNDCSSCHTIPSSSVSGWVQSDANGNVTNYYHKQINWTTGAVTNVAVCKNCHDTSKQTIKVYKTESGQRTYKGEILISSLGLSGTEATTLSTRTGHYTNGFGSECSACHSIPTTTQQWSATHASVSGDCNQCHVKAPTNLVSKTGTHPSVASGGTCIGCHGSSTKNWADGKAMDHTGATACTTCHNFNGTTYTSPSGKVTGQKTVSFTVQYDVPLTETHAHDTTTNCSTCHATPSPSATTFTNTWTTFEHPQFNNAAVTDLSCKNCHNQAIARPVKPDAGKSSHTHTAFKNGQCGMCHYPKSNTTFTSRKTQAHSTYKDKGTYSCTYCHN